MSAALTKALIAAGFPSRVASALAHGGVITTLDQLRAEPCGYDKPEDRGLGWRLSTHSRFGPQGIAEVLPASGHHQQAERHEGAEHGGSSLAERTATI